MHQQLVKKLTSETHAASNFLTADFSEHALSAWVLTEQKDDVM